MNDNIKAGADIHAGDGGYTEGTQESYDKFVKTRNQSLGKMRIKERAKQSLPSSYLTNCPSALEKFAELIVAECTQVLFQEAERLYGLASEETSLIISNDLESCAENCMNNIVIIEEHFGVE